MFLSERFFSLRLLGVVVLAASVVQTVGCASPGQPLPPSLHLPGLAQQVTAERDGDTVRLAWTTPATTTDKERVRGTVTAVICLDVNPSGAVVETRKPAKKQNRQAVAGPGTALPHCNATETLPVAAVGAMSTEVKLMPELTSGSTRLVAYRIQLNNDQGRSAGPSEPAYVAAGVAPAAVGELTVTAKREGALVRWTPLATGAAMEVKRTLIATAAGPVAVQTTKRAGPAPFAPNAGKTPAREVVLRAEFQGRDAGGMVDTTVVDGSTYTYVAQRVLTVKLGDRVLELRGKPSPVATFAYRDTFPPDAPTGLVLVPGGGFGEAPSIDLSWNANPETDVLGYNVYRREGGGGFEKLTAEPVPAPAFRDMHVEAGHQYTYRVTAVDQRKNESAAGAEISERLR